MIAVAMVLAIVATAPPPPPPPPLVQSQAPNEVVVVDGGTLRIRTFLIRLAAVEGLDRSQQCLTSAGFNACGRRAASRLAELVHGRNVACAIVAEVKAVAVGQDDLLVGRCASAGLDLAQVLVDEGQAVAVAGSPYFTAAQQACLAQRGAWSGVFEAPWTLRARTEGVPMAARLMGAGSRTPCLVALKR